MTDCGHPFCNSCLKPMLTLGRMECPVCRKQLTASQIYPNKLHERQILSLKIQCDQSKDGCKWTGELRQREDHERKCQCLLVPCKMDCGKKVMRKHMQTHLRSGCPKRRATCPHCGVPMEYSKLDSHCKTCEKYPVPCVHGCGVTVARNHMAYHGTCPKSILECDFKEAGCNFKGNPMSLGKHLGNNLADHVDKLMTTVCQLKSTVAQQDATIQRLKRAVGDQHMKKKDGKRLLMAESRQESAVAKRMKIAGVAEDS